MGITYTTTVSGEPGKNVTGLPVPTEVVAALGTQKRPKVTVSLKGYRYRSAVAAYGDVFILPLSQEHRATAGVQAGDRVEVTLELDLEPRTVDVPDDLRAALEGKTLFSQVWETNYTDDTRTLDVHVSWLRQAIEADPDAPQFLTTIRGVGYRLDV